MKKIKSQAMATKLANRNIRGFSQDIRSTNATKSKLPHALDETGAQCENARCVNISSDIGSNIFKILDEVFT